MDSTVPGKKPKSALPAYLTNGTSPLHTSVESRHRRERENLYASIHASSGHQRHLVDFDRPQMPRTVSDNNAADGGLTTLAAVEEPARDPRDRPSPPTPLATSRPASPYTQNPTIDFDGLSWPSEFPVDDTATAWPEG